MTEMHPLHLALESLNAFDRRLVGGGYDDAMKFLGELIDLEVKSVPSGTQLGTWTVPNAWRAKEAWVKFKGKKILDIKKEPLCLVDYSLPFQGTLSKEEFKKKLYHHEELEDATPYVFKFYDRDWGFCAPKMELEEGDYEVFIDVEETPGDLKYGIHTLKGKSDREVLVFAHLDHPYQANDNLSAIGACLTLARKYQGDHTLKIVFCPETIGSQAYIYNEDLSKVDFVVAIDICGNDNTLMLQKSFNDEERINRVAHCAFQMAARPYRKGKFRTMIGSDETAFNDPTLCIPGILLTRWPYPEYHSNKDTVDKLDYDKIVETAEMVQSIIDIYERDYIPVRKFKGPLMRSRYGIQSPVKVVNLNFDYLFYSMDGKKTLAELCSEFELPFEEIYRMMEKIIEDGQVERRSIDSGEGKL